jgi:hypothetical protein
VNNGLERMWKEAAIASSEKLTQHMPAGNGENSENP